MKHPGLSRLRLAAALACLAAASWVSAHVATDVRGASLDVKVGEAEFIVRGVVSEIRYGYSRQVSEEEPPIPHTFVTYKIREVLKGEGDQRQLTLRFMGGPDGAGGYLTVQDVPLFEEGDEDILLVKGNGEVLCPLVRCDGGRYRIVDDRVYTNAGMPLLVGEQGELILGARRTDVGVREVRLPVVEEDLARREAELRDRVLETLPPELQDAVRATWAAGAEEARSLRPMTSDGSVDTAEEAIPEGARPLQVEALTKRIRRIVEARPGQVGRLRSVDPQARFEVPPPKPARPLEPEGRPGLTEQERLELKRIEESGGDPVIHR